MNFGARASALSEHSVCGLVGLAKLSMSVCRLSWVRSITSGSAAVEGVATHVRRGVGGVGGVGVAEGLGDGDGLGAGEGAGDAAGIDGDSVTGDGDGMGDI